MTRSSLVTVPTGAQTRTCHPGADVTSQKVHDRQKKRGGINVLCDEASDASISCWCCPGQGGGITSPCLLCQQRTVDSINITICPAGIYCGLLFRIWQAVFNKHIPTFSKQHTTSSVHNATNEMQTDASAAWTHPWMSFLGFNYSRVSWTHRLRLQSAAGSKTSD